MGEGSYFNFDLILERVGGKYWARVFDSPVGQASVEFDLPFSELELENFVLRMGRPRSGVRRVDSSEMEAVKQCGERLFRAIFSDDVYASFLRSRDTAFEEGKGLRVRLRIDVPEFHDYPWEYLYNAHLNQFLALSKDTPVVRYLELPYPVQPLTVQPPLKILVMISSPEGFPQLQVEEEWKRLTNALAPLVRRSLVALERLKKPTLSALQQQLRRGEYHIFHFIGHGKYSEHKQDGMLLLEEESGHGRPVSGQYLGTVLHDHRSLRLVVLNACEGARTSQEDPYAGVAQTLVLQGIPAVIAMQFEIVETAAITFAQEFYGAVADGFPVDAAVSEARKAIFAAGNDVEWGTPVLYMRTPQGVIFEIPEAQRVRPSLGDEPETFVDRELEQKLDGLYTEGLAAFWVEDWDKACDRFQRILTDQPDHVVAAGKLAEARRQRNLVLLYNRAVEAQKAENWTAALKTLEELLKDSPEYKDASSMLKIVKKQKQLAELYTEAKRLHAAKKWQAVAKVFTQIKSIDPNYPDPENLLPTAEKELDELKRQAELNELFGRAVHEIDTGHWAEAQRLLKQVQGIEPGFLETGRLLSRVETEIRQSEEKQIRQNQINTLYEQAHGLLRSKKWRQVLDKIEDIRRLDEQFEDPEKIAERAQEELVREEQETERQNELAAMYAEAVRLVREEKYQEALERLQGIKAIDSKYPDRQMVQWTAKRSLAALAKPIIGKRRTIVPQSLWIGLGGIISLVVLGFVIALFVKRVNTMYDDFDDHQYNGAYDNTKWDKAHDMTSSSKIFQEDGLLVLEQSGPNQGFGIGALSLNTSSTFPVDGYSYLEIKMMVENVSYKGELSIQFWTDKTFFLCGLDGNSGVIYRHCWREDRGGLGGNFRSLVRYSGTSNKWYVINVKIDPFDKIINFYFDGQKVASYPLDEKETLPNGFGLGCYVAQDNDFKGYIDYVKQYTSDE